MITFLRRTVLSGGGAGDGARFLSRIQAKAGDATAIDFGAVLKYPFSVPALTYAYDANEPSIDAQTMQLHHDKHHAAYVSNLNTALKDHAELQPMALHEILAHLADLPEAIRTTFPNTPRAPRTHDVLATHGRQGGRTWRRSGCCRRSRFRLLGKAPGGLQSDSGARIWLGLGDGAGRFRRQAISRLEAKPGFADNRRS